MPTQKPSHANDMMRHLLNIAFCVIVSLGVLAPKVSGALSAVIPGWSFVYICAGNESLVLLLDASGDPVELAQQEMQDCPIPEAGVGFEAQLLYWQHLALSHARVFHISVNRRLNADRFARIPPKRPPPYLV